MFPKNMLYLYFILTLSHLSFAAVFLWSDKHIQLSPLRIFNNEDFKDLQKHLNAPRTIILRNPTDSFPSELKTLSNGYFTAFSPNNDLILENVIDLNGNSSEDLTTIKKEMGKLNSTNFLVLMISSEKRRRPRSIEGEEEEVKDKNVTSTVASTTVTESEILRSIGPIEGPVFYKAKSKKDNTYALLYSSEPLQIISKDWNITLGNTSPDMITVDTTARDSFTRLNIVIPRDQTKVTLRFLFSWQKTYWYIKSVIISDTVKKVSLNLTIQDKQAFAPAGFSYHCGGTTTFLNTTNSAALYLYNMQLQIDSKNGKFGDAYDCVHFTTPAIWSAVMVTFILGAGLTVAILALFDIKTMDKFDNQKTKQLAINVME